MRLAMIRLAICAALLAATAPALALAQAPETAATAPQEELVKVAIDTSLGRIVVALDKGRAPLTTANFLRYVDGDKFDGETFYRAMKMHDGGLIQGGIRTDGRKLMKPVAHEPTSQTGIKNVAGAISAALAA